MEERSLETPLRQTRCPSTPHTLADHIRRSLPEALVPEDLENHVQLNRARLTSYVVLREEINTYCECRGHAHARSTKPKGPSHPGGVCPVHIGAFRQRRREARTASTEQGFNRMLGPCRALPPLEGLMGQEGPDQ